MKLVFSLSTSPKIILSIIFSWNSWKIRFSILKYDRFFTKSRPLKTNKKVFMRTLIVLMWGLFGLLGLFIGVLQTQKTYKTQEMQKVQIFWDVSGLWGLLGLSGLSSLLDPSLKTNGIAKKKKKNSNYIFFKKKIGFWGGGGG